MHTCIPSHRLKRSDIHVLGRRTPATNTHPACTIQEDGMWLPVWLDSENGHICKNLTKNGEPQRYSWEWRRRRDMASLLGSWHNLVTGWTGWPGISVHCIGERATLICSLYFNVAAYRGFPTTLVYLYYISCLRHTILVGSPQYGNCSSGSIVETHFICCWESMQV